MDVDCRPPNAASVLPDTCEHAHHASTRAASGTADGRGRLPVRIDEIVTL